MPPGNWSLNILQSEGNLGPNRIIQEDLALPVVIDPGVDSANPDVLDWRVVSTTQPNKATFHINHSDVTNVRVGVLRASDFPLDTPFVLAEDLPIVIIDSLDKYWAGESRTALPLGGLRVPVEGDTEDEAKANLARDLAAQFRLLLLLHSSRSGDMAPELLKNIEYLSSVMTARES